MLHQGRRSQPKAPPPPAAAVGEMVAVDTLSILKDRFGYDSFWSPQEEIIDDVLANRDVLAVMPTGGGKSLCYQLPALVLNGVTLVVSPLIALMKDQVDALNANGISSRFINSSLSYREAWQVQEAVKAGQVKLLYAAPERLSVPNFRRFLSEININLIAIDEAHCISEWGHEFRPDYRNLLDLRRSFPDTPVIALTATATERVRQDIGDQLAIGKDRTYVSSFNRPNLNYSVQVRDSNAPAELLTLLASHHDESTIIYCFSRRDTEELASLLNANGFTARPYHAGLTPETRRETQDNFIQDRVPIITATIAFGMGIDKPDVRLVVHYSLPKSIEAYYQETGRAGRDGLPSDCVAFFGLRDRSRQEYFINQMGDEKERRNASQKLDKMVEYAQSLTCRRHFLLGYFGERYGEKSCGACDACLEPKQTYDATEITLKILSAIVRTKEMFGAGYIVRVLLGSRDKRILAAGHDELSVYGIAKDYSRKQLNDLIGQLQARGILVRGNHEYPTLVLSDSGWELLRNRLTISLVKPTEGHTGQRHGRGSDPVRFDRGLFDKLRALRRRLAERSNIPPYVVFGDVSLRQMAAMYPQDEGEFSNILGVGKLKLDLYGNQFLKVIRDYVSENNITIYRAKSSSVTASSTGSPTIRRPLGPTFIATKELLAKGLTLGEIADARGLARSTIAGHIERIIENGEPGEIKHLLPSEERISKIKEAFRQAESDLLGPAKELLGDDFAYDEILLARLYLNLMANRPDK